VIGAYACKAWEVGFDGSVFAPSPARAVKILPRICREEKERQGKREQESEKTLARARGKCGRKGDVAYA